MRVLITGAAGFLGSHLMLHHLFEGDDVVGIDNFCSSERSSGHLNAIMKFVNGTIDDVDICDEAEMRNYMEGPHIDLVYNFACPASPPRYQSMPVETLMTCTLGTKNVLDVAKHHLARVVHASTSEVYGDPEMSPQVETYRGNTNSYGPRACYDEGKRAAEALCFDYLNKHNVDVRLVRIFNTYGTHMDVNDGRVVSNFICQALRGEPLTVYGGAQTRSFCYVDDLVRGITSLARIDVNPRTPINIGNQVEFTVRELAEKVQAKLGGEFDIRTDLPIDDPTRRCPDTTLARQLLDWQPRVQLDEGLDKTIEYFRKRLACSSPR